MPVNVNPDVNPNPNPSPHPVAPNTGIEELQRAAAEHAQAAAPKVELEAPNVTPPVVAPQGASPASSQELRSLVVPRSEAPVEEQTQRREPGVVAGTSGYDRSLVVPVSTPPAEDVPPSLSVPASVPPAEANPQSLSVPASTPPVEEAASGVTPDLAPAPASTLPPTVEVASVPAAAPAPAEPVAAQPEPERVDRTPVHEPQIVELGHPLFVRPEGFDPMDHVDVPPDATSELPDTRLYDSLQTVKDIALSQAGTRRIGSANQDVITGDPNVRIEEIAVSAAILVEDWRQPTSFIRTIMTQLEPTIDQAAMVEDYDLALDAMMRLFNNHDILGLCEKTVNDEATTHTRVVRAHLGTGTRINAMIAKQFNADFDGDKLKVSFDPEAIAGAKNAIAFLTGTEGDLKIDPDFFAIHPWAGGFDGIKAQLAAMLAEFNPTTTQLNGLAMAIETWKDDKAAEAGLKSIVRWARVIGATPVPGHSESWGVGEILQRIYDVNRAILKTSLLIRGVANAQGVIPQLERTDQPYGPIGVVEDVAPEPPANMADAAAAHNAPAGMVPGKNMAFRIAAGWGKMVRASKLIMGKHSAVHARTFLHTLALQMSGVKDFDEGTRGVTELVRRAIIDTVGAPDLRSDKHFIAWLHKFASAYNTQAYIVNSASVRVKLDKTLAPSERFYMAAIAGETGSSEKNEQTRKAFRMVFGNIRMGVLFDKNCPEGYKYYTLDEYIMRNKEPLEFLGSSTDKLTTIDGFIGRLADMRTTFARKVYDELHGTADKPGALAAQMITVDGKRMTLLGALIDALEKHKADGSGPVHLERELELLVQAFHFLGQEMFTYLGLDNPAAFETTALGRRIKNATSEDELLGAIYEAIASYRFAPVKALQQRYDDAMAAGDYEKAGDYAAKYEAELDAIASSSDTWATIIRKYKQGRYVDGKNVLDAIFFSGKGGAWIETKLNNTVRADPMGRPEQQVWEVAADLYANPKGMHARSRFMSDFGHGQLLSDLKMASDKIDAYGEVNWSHCQESVLKAEERFNGELKDFLAEVRKDPRTLVEFKSWMISDAILTVLEKSYPSTEKAQQETASNYIYAAVSHLLNGGIWSDMAVGGDFSVNKIALDRFWKTPLLLAKLLSDPNFTVTVYSGDGEVTLSMEKLLGTRKPTEGDLWQFLKDNPRAAMALRTTAQSNGIGPKGTAYTTATKSLEMTMEEVLAQKENLNRVDELAMMSLADNPGFYALVAMTLKMSGERRFQLRDTTTMNVGRTVDFLRGLTADGAPSKATVDATIDQLFLDTFGPERVDLINKTYALGRSQESGPLGTADADDVRDDENYHLGQIRNSMKLLVFEYATKLTQDKNVPSAPRMSAEAVRELFHLEDESTRRTYFDVIQTVGNVKTELSTSINGAESRRLAAAMFLAFITPEPCDAPTPPPMSYLKFATDWSKYLGMKATTGNGVWVTVNETTWQDLAADGKDTGIIVEDPSMCTSPTCPCKRHATADQSTNYGGFQTPAFVRLLTIVRTLSAEKLNLKSKTQGDDGSDSIVKNRLFDVMDPKITAKVNSRYRQVLTKTGDPVVAMAAARVVLAGQLAKVFSSMRYSTEITHNDYLNVAQVMIREVPGADGTAELKVLAMGQINALVERAIRDERNANPGITHDDAVRVATYALTDLERIGGELDVDTVMAGFKVHREQFLSPQVLSQRESSMGRNMDLVARIVEETGVTPIGDKELDQYESQLRGQFAELFNKWQRWAGKVPEKFRDGDENRYTYRVIGVWGVGAIDAGDHITHAMTSNSKPAVGPRNAYIVSSSSPDAVEAVAIAYRHGVNVIVDGRLTKNQWVAIYKRTGIDPNQSTWLYSRAGKAMGQLIPMFDLRLNGRNTTLREGAFNAGSFWADPLKGLGFFFESVVNEHSAGDGDFVRTRMTDSIKHFKRGEYRVSVHTAFANLLSLVEEQENPRPGGRIPQTKGDVKLIIFGGRDFKDYATLKRAIEGSALYRDGRIGEVVTGKAKGADSLGERWAREQGIPVKEFKADWDDLTAPDAVIKYHPNKKPYNSKAGTARNTQMFNYATHGFGFWDGTSAGTGDMRSKLLEGGKEVRVLYTGTGALELNGRAAGNIGEYKPHKVKEHGIPEAEVAAGFDVQMYILDPFEEGRLEDIPIDLGMPIVDDVEHVRLVEGLKLFAARAARGELGPDGILHTARPGEIIGFMRAEVGEEVRYHPIRPYEAGNAGGAPQTMEIESAKFDESTGEIVVKWVHRGNMAGRYFKLFEDGNASVKLMARPDPIDDIELEDGSPVMGYLSVASTASRRLLQRRQQKMLTLIYKARTAPFGYNLAEVDGTFAGEPQLKQMVLTGHSSIGAWKTRLRQGPINFIADAELNGLLNYMAERCVRYGIDPTLMFASQHGGVPNNKWFNYQLLLKGGPAYQSSLMRFMHLMNPELVPDGLDDTSDAKTLFDRNLQVLRPVRDEKGSVIGHERVDLYGGWHFLDDHYAGRSGSGTTVSTYALPSLPAMMAGGKRLPMLLLNQVLNWANIGDDVESAQPSRVRSADDPDAS